MEKEKKIQYIIELFAFNEKQQNLYLYIKEYVELLNVWLKDNTFDNFQLIRYMLIGLYLEYRASVHHGSNFNTYIENWTYLERRPETKEKLILFNDFYGKEIESTEEYLNIIRQGFIKKLTGKHLFEYVINDKAIVD